MYAFKIYVRTCHDIASAYHVNNMQKMLLGSEKEMLAFGAALAKSSMAGDVIFLRGDLGAGKTTLARGFIQSLVADTDVPSPTYTLVQTYEAEGVEIWHCDLYRLEQADDILELGLLEAFEDCICLIEWPERMGGYAPAHAKTIEIEFDGAGRAVICQGWDKGDIIV